MEERGIPREQDLCRKLSLDFHSSTDCEGAPEVCKPLLGRVGLSTRKGIGERGGGVAPCGLRSVAIGRCTQA